MEILFKRDTAFRKQFFVPDSFAHPAKMDAQLLIWLVEHYSHPGETLSISALSSAQIVSIAPWVINAI